MNFTPELPFDGGRVRPMTYDDVDALFAIYQHPEIPGQHVPDNKDNLTRMVDLSVQMAATQRGMMWLLEVGSDDNYEVQGMVSAYDWQPSQLRTMLRVDGLPQLSAEHRAAALNTCLEFMSGKYHLRNFGYQWIAGQDEALNTLLQDCGFSLCATLRDGWRTGTETFADVVQFHKLLDVAKPVPGRLGEQDNPGQNLDKSFADKNGGGAA